MSNDRNMIEFKDESLHCNALGILLQFHKKLWKLNLVYSLIDAQLCHIESSKAENFYFSQKRTLVRQ